MNVVPQTIEAAQKVGAIRVKKQINPFVMLSRQAVQDETLSWKARGILAYLLSLPDDWKIYVSELERHATDGRESTQTAFNELRAAGYIVRHGVRDGKGKFKGFNYDVSDTKLGNPITGNPITGNPITGNPITGNPLLHNNHLTEETLNKINIEKSIGENEFSKNEFSTPLKTENFDLFEKPAAAEIITNGVGGYNTGDTPPVTAAAKAKRADKVAALKAVGIPAELNTVDFLKEWHIILGEPKWRGKSTSAIEKTLEQLQRYPVAYAVVLLKAAIANNWQGVTYESTPAAFAKWQREQQTADTVNGAGDRRTMTESEKNAANIAAASDAIWQNIQNGNGIFSQL